MNEFSDYLKHIKILIKDFRAAVDPFIDENQIKNKQEQLKSIENTISLFTQSNLKVPNVHKEFRLKLINEIKLANNAINAYQEYVDILRSNLTPPLTLTRLKKQTHLQINELSPVSQSEGNFVAAKQNEAQSDSSGLPVKYARLKKAEITLSDIIQAGIIPPNSVILKEFQGRIYRGTITVDGKIRMKAFGTITYPDPDYATKAITDLSIDGWQWWYVFIDKCKRPLNDLRVIYLKGMS